MSRDILILGGAGQVGTELQHHAWPADVTLQAPAREALDITDEAAVEAAVAGRPYAAVINAAAYTAVDKAESEVGAAWRLNALGPAYLAAATARAGIPLVHVSTDYVFDGTGTGAYATDAPVRPRSVYGASKAAGEMAVRTANPRHAIVRTAWVVSPHRGNFVRTMLRLAGEREKLTVVDDQRGCPTSAADLAAALAAIALRLADDPAAPTGTYHCVNAGATTWCGFARAIMAGAESRGARSVPVEPIPTSAYPTPAARPANSELSTETLARDFGVTPRPWPAALDDILDQLIGPARPA
ncbi:dTDP-4-dehydrorhamnose reductase [Methylobacterium isbiliense]|jgi:dTDP-4-dehydrorhamnose reductase|uniref:dTDP-4-dehydrorhamnose reductase n=1 Tax=Methylobacterium isbiliense TaxID=315478 RepID=A0ABQ4SP67_9HYPH|nr:dTDP-4-dehydrorhamnose reductase [Methylobacterium isbiliense]MDN3627599.1 dTDP-4-dehydrorhamnose reductase [Methylobacterium isbiliense]GJE04228.1 dTDP-4-dehydrorhamnose reductase [Methylobacterium isbiliense]